MHQGFIPRYRVRFFELLSQQSDIDYVIVYGPPPSGTGHFASPGPFGFPTLKLTTRELSLGRRTLIYHSIAPVLRGRFDALVIGTHLLLIANHVLFAAFKARGKPVLYWGHGHEQAEAALKSRLARLADGYLAYTEGGAARLAAAGVRRERIAVARNTLDIDQQIELHHRQQHVDERQLRSELNLRSDSVVLLYLGRVYPEKRVVELLEVVSLAGASVTPPVETVIIGDGPELEAVRAAARGHENVHILGQIANQETIARYLHIATAVVIPGVVGLAINHAFAHGTPIVTLRDNAHGPEIEFLEDRVNGLLVAGGVNDLASALVGLVNSACLQRKLAAGALATRSRLGLEEMVNGFDEAVRHALRQRRGGHASTNCAAAIDSGKPGRH